MFNEDTEWDGPDLDSSLSAALLAKPVATPERKVPKSKNKFRPGVPPTKKKTKAETNTVPATTSTPLGKRKRTVKPKGDKTKKVRHAKCAVFDDITNWDDIITNHEAEDPDNENLADFVSNAASEILKENTAINAQTPAAVPDTNKKSKKSKKKKVKFTADDNVDLLSQSMTGGAGTAMSNLNLEGLETESTTESTTSSLQSAKEKITKLKGKFQKKMDASQFRFINEKLYTTTGEDAMALFAKKPELFDVYHRGFSNQVDKWEVNPVDRIIEYITSRGDDQVVADFGCGDAKIARTLKNAVFSFDLVKCNEHVIVANSSKVPLGDKSVDIAVFCLSLMGVDFKDYIREARRVLRSKGTLCVAEVVSRIPDLDAFIAGVEELGFKMLHKSEPNNYFVEVFFKKRKPQENKGRFESLELKPCTYKKR